MQYVKIVVVVLCIAKKNNLYNFELKILSNTNNILSHKTKLLLPTNLFSSLIEPLTNQ